MVTSEVRYTPAAEQDVREAVDYLLAEDVSAALLLLNELDRVGVELARFPELGPLSRNAMLASKGLRIMVLTSYNAFYTVEKGTVWIVRVLHSRRDADGLL